MASLVDETSQKENSNQATDMSSTQLKRFLDDDTFDSFEFNDPLPELEENSDNSPIPSPKKLPPEPAPATIASKDFVEPSTYLAEDGADKMTLLNELEEDSMDDVGQIKKKYMSKIMNYEDEFNSSQVPVDTISKREVQDLIDTIPKPMVQKPFQPGSSPADEDNRFLCWNNIGIIRAQSNEEEQSIDVMFHDTEKHSSLNFKNDSNYTYGSMSDDAVVVASNGKYGTGPSTVYGINLLEGNRDRRGWEVELPHVELIEGLAVGNGFVAIASDQRNLRLFTSGGMQSYIFTLSGPVLTMAAYENQLMIVYHNGAGHSEDQNLSVTVYHIDLLNDTIRLKHNNIPLPLSKRSPLYWAGFSDEGTPCSYDFNGILRIYCHDLAQTWMPFLDLRELTTSALDHFFVVGVSELSQSVRAVKCRRSRYPSFETETAGIYDFKLPVCDTATDKGKYEEEHIRLRLAARCYRRLGHIESISTIAESSSEANEKLLVNTILRLFAIYLNEDKEELAKSLVYMIPKSYMSMLPEFAWKTNRRQYFIDALNKAIEEREQLDLVPAEPDDDVVSISSMASHHNFGKDLKRELNKTRKSENDEVMLKPIPLDKLMTNTNNIDNNPKLITADDESGDENDAKRAKRTKSINYNLFSKKRPRNN